MKIISIMKEHPLKSYVAVTFALSWGFVVAMAGPGNIPIVPEKTGDMLPLLYISMLMGPSAAGLLLTGLLEGRAGFRELIIRLFKWRVGILWYVVALAAVPLLALLVLCVLSYFSPVYLPAVFISDDRSGLLMNGLVAGVMVGFFEELGWTGFALPILSRRHSPLYAGIILGLLWGIWHFIIFWENDSFFATLPLLILLARLLDWLPPFRVIMTWIYGRTGSLPIVMLTHASLVVAVTVLPPMTMTRPNLLTWLLLWSIVLWAAVAVLIVARPEQLLRRPTAP